MDLSAALKWVDEAVTTRTGRALRDPEVVILTGTWRGLTYQQMAEGSEYSTNYLMRDVAPKLWKRLSNVFGRPVGKTNFRVAIESQGISTESTEQKGDQKTPPESVETSFGESDLTLFPPETDSQYSAPAGTTSAEAARFWYSAGSPILSAASLRPAPLYGYESDLAALEGWLTEAADEPGNRSHLIGIWGLRGVGKTLLVETAISRQGDRFDTIIRRSLRDRPTLDQLSASILTILGSESQPAQGTAQRLLNQLSYRSLLLIIEDVEAILEPNVLAGNYHPGYRSYRDFFKALTETIGSSCMVLMGIEGPTELVRQGGDAQMESVRSHFLIQLSEENAIALARAELSAESDAEPPTELEPPAELQINSPAAPNHYLALVRRYQCHPAALKLATRVIKDLFSGKVNVFLAESSTLFNDISQLLIPSCDRLSSTEANILYWLACQEQPLSLSELKQTLPSTPLTAEIISALDSLKQRSLINITSQSDSPSFHLPALVNAFALYKLTEQLSSDGASILHLESTATAYEPEFIIDLNSTFTNRPTHLSQWFQAQYDPGWQTLDYLFESASRFTTRLRNAFHLRNKAFLKRCKPVVLGEFSGTAEASMVEVALLVAISQDTPGLYQICVQVQPRKGDSVLPNQLSLRLLDPSQTVLTTVQANATDTVIQLPFIRGAETDSFIVEIAIDETRQLETFVV